MTAKHLKYFIAFSCAVCWITVLSLLPDFPLPIVKENIREVIGQTIIFFVSFSAMMASFLLTEEKHGSKNKP